MSIRRVGLNITEKIPTQVQFGHVFLIRLLEAVFQPAGLQPGKYSSKIPTYLLERKLISDSMFEGGVLKALQDRNDWVSSIGHL